MSLGIIIQKQLQVQLYVIAVSKCTSHSGTTYVMCTSHTLLYSILVRSGMLLMSMRTLCKGRSYSNTEVVVCISHTLLYSISSRSGMLLLHTLLYSILARSGMLLMSMRTLSKGQSWYTPAPVLPAITLNSSGCLASDSSSNSSGRDFGAK